MDLRKFDYFLRVAELGSFSRAAASLHITQPVLSRQIRRLEEELGLALFYRNGRGVMLTQGGQCLLENARSMQATLNSTMAELAAIKNEFVGHASIGMPSSVGRVMAVPLARMCREQFPNVHLHIVEAFSGDIVERLHHGRLDIAVTYTSASVQGFAIDPVAVEKLMLVSPPGQRPAPVVDLATLAGLPLILSGPAHPLRIEIERAARAAGLTLNMVMEVDALSAMLQMIEVGFGHAIMPPSALAGAPEEGPGTRHLCTTPLAHDMPEHTLFVASGPQRSSSAPVRHLARMVRQVMLDLVGPDTWRPCHWA
ncbi:MAG TPA: LysR family transcriptional regulator [Novosphingobium sp.]|nr:LysR family transcriptional regulator [Novosphingobium sp.]